MFMSDITGENRINTTLYIIHVMLEEIYRKGQYNSAKSYFSFKIFNYKN